MDPIEALHAVAFQLERASAPAYRVRAFRRAAQVIADLPRSELERRIATGALEELAGIGPATAAVITEAGGGQQPAYLARLLEEAAVGPRTAMRAALRGDCHSHSDWSSKFAGCTRILDRNALAFCLYNGQRGTGLGIAADCFPVGALKCSDLPRPRLQACCRDRGRAARRRA